MRIAPREASQKLKRNTPGKLRIGLPISVTPLLFALLVTSLSRACGTQQRQKARRPCIDHSDWVAANSSVQLESRSTAFDQCLPRRNHGDGVLTRQSRPTVCLFVNTGGAPRMQIAAIGGTRVAQPTRDESTAPQVAFSARNFEIRKTNSTHPIFA